MLRQAAFVEPFLRARSGLLAPRWRAWARWSAEIVGRGSPSSFGVNPGDSSSVTVRFQTLSPDAVSANQNYLALRVFDGDVVHCVV